MPGDCEVTPDDVVLVPVEPGESGAVGVLAGKPPEPVPAVPVDPVCASAPAMGAAANTKPRAKACFIVVIGFPLPARGKRASHEQRGRRARDLPGRGRSHAYVAFV